MLTRLLPDQVSKLWDVIKYAIEQSLPPVVGEHPDKMNRVLSALLSSKIQCWVSYTRNNGGAKFEGVVVTEMLYDDPSNTKNLLIYCLYGYNPVNNGSWMNGLKALVKYAKSKGCNQIIAYTDLPYIIDLVNNLGGETKYTFCSFNVDEIVQKLNGLDGE